MARTVTQITESGFAMTSDEKAAVSRAVGRNRYTVFGSDGAIYSTTCTLLVHAVDDARKCGGELWLAGRCTVPAHNVV